MKDKITFETTCRNEAETALHAFNLNPSQREQAAELIRFVYDSDVTELNRAARRNGNPDTYQLSIELSLPLPWGTEINRRKPTLYIHTRVGREGNDFPTIQRLWMVRERGGVSAHDGQEWHAGRDAYYKSYTP